MLSPSLLTSLAAWYRGDLGFHFHCYLHLSEHPYLHLLSCCDGGDDGDDDAHFYHDDGGDDGNQWKKRKKQHQWWDDVHLGGDGYWNGHRWSGRDELHCDGGDDDGMDGAELGRLNRGRSSHLSSLHHNRPAGYVWMLSGVSLPSTMILP